MQHLAVVGSAGLTWPNRAHMWIGVMSYLASPLWLLLIAVGLGVTAHIATVQFEYFTDEVSLFPRWPRFDTERMIALFVVAMATLLAPKILGLLRAVITRELIGRSDSSGWCSECGRDRSVGALRADHDADQTRQVWEILRGQDSGWTTQSRQRAGSPWRTLRRHWMHMIAGLGVAAGLTFISLPLLVWMAPALVGLVLALPLSAASGSEFFAKLTRIFGFSGFPRKSRSRP
jgi:membrane glycosyltransferase